MLLLDEEPLFLYEPSSHRCRTSLQRCKAPLRWENEPLFRFKTSLHRYKMVLRWCDEAFLVSFQSFVRAGTARRPARIIRSIPCRTISRCGSYCFLSNT